MNTRLQYAVRWVVVISATSTVLYLITHHIALDGSSMSILASEFFTIIDEEHRKECCSGVITTGRRHTSHTAIQPGASTRAGVHGLRCLQASESFWLSQLVDVSPFKWHGVLTSTTSHNYCEIQKWGTFSKKDLPSWGNRYKTSWFPPLLYALFSRL
ncbi:hypothetical protein M422DRAFT_260299 [Sphaerobolus stellatus SS14]|uniref:Uncharacterized protein n=1 Tax=Sphaerobolus stellatus (strain SS14) TaxID=990650 RepID=A0A0C9VHZ1_SPHS4|nr:hypothetical protein M422DRAFT_260299 [Sphaerobolus stellatus SS14]